MSSSQNNPEKNAVGYNRWASFYDLYPNPTVAVDELEFPRLWLGVAGKDVLEIGCGTGRHTTKLVAAGNKVTGIDVSPGMLSVAREKLNGKVATFIEGDFIAHEGFRPERFDAVISSLVIEHIANLEVLFEKIAFVLKPGAHCFLSEIHPSRAAQGRLAHFKDDQTDEEIWLASHPHLEEEVQSAASRAGFNLVIKKDVLGDDRLIAARPAWSKYIGIPMIQIWQFQK